MADTVRMGVKDRERDSDKRFPSGRKRWRIKRDSSAVRKRWRIKRGASAVGKRWRRKRGSSAVLLTCILLSMILAVGIIGEASSRRASKAVAECALETAGRAVLAGYDRTLKERYGLFAFERDEDALRSILKELSEESLTSFPLTECTIQEISAEKAAYCLGDPDIMEEQIEEVMKYRIIADKVEDVLTRFQSAGDAVDLLGDEEKKKEALEAAKEEQRRLSSSPSDGGGGDSSGQGDALDFEKADRVHGNLKAFKEDAEDRISEEEDGNGSLEDTVLRNENISDALPSILAGCKENTAFSGVVSALKKFPELIDFDRIKSEIYTDEYIKAFFSAYTDEKSEERFFRNEIEYILYGSNSDRENFGKAKRTVYVMRTALNMAYIYGSPDMLRRTLTAAESLTPGPFAPLTQLLIIAAWSALEAYNDVVNLEEGNRIPLIKSASTWKTDLSAVAGGEFNGRMIPNDSDLGMDYKSYLMILLLTEDRETKLLRIMDLIQINLKGSERKDFVFGNLFCGFVLEAEIEKKSIYGGVGSGTTAVRMTHTY